MTISPSLDTKEKKILLGSELDERLKEFKAGNKKGVPRENVKAKLEEKWGSFDYEGYRKQVEEERVEKELNYLLI